MADPMDLEGVIEDSINDTLTPSETDTTPDSEPVYSQTTSDTDGDSRTKVEPEADADTPAQESSQVAAPGATITEPAQDADEFAKRFGLQSQSVTGRENRIPYSRVKKIVARAEQEATAKAKKDLEATPQPKLVEYETKVKDYEDRLGKVAQFEQMIEFQPKEFLNFLSTIPAYKEFFDHINQLATAQQQAQPKTEEAYLDPATMPQPDEKLSDGSMVYSLAGLAKRDEWLARQIEAKALAAAEARIAQRYKPMEDQWQAEQRRQQAIPLIQKQIAEARTWPGFVDSEAEIIEALKADPNLTLEAAHRKIVVPKLEAKIQASQPDRNKMRQEILEELKRKPVSTSAPTSQVKPQTPSAGNRSLEDIIQEAANSLKR